MSGVQGNSSRDLQDEEQPHSPETYLDLIEKVGGIGKYQYILSGVVACSWFTTGIVLLSTALGFLNPEFDCEAFGLLTTNCYDFVCALPKQQWASYVTTEQNQYRSFANDFGQYFCEDAFYIDLFSSSPYFGSLLGFLFVTFFSDNVGRRKTIIVAWGLSCIGILIVMASKLTNSIATVVIGLTMAGFGMDSVVIVTGSLLSEQCSDVPRQKIFAIVQGAFTVGALMVTLAYYIWEDWFITVTFFLLIPSIITYLGFIFYVKQSPLYLIRQNKQNALKQLNDIGKTNQGNNEILTIQDIDNVIIIQEANQFKQISTLLDPFRYASLRLRTITQGIVNISTFLMYYGPTLIISQFGFDIYTSNTILNVADILTYYPLMVIIDKIKRRKACMIQLGVASIICGILIFLVAPEDCDGCYIIYIQLALIFVFRFMISMEFAIIGIYQAELYPTRVRNISVGVLNIFGTVASTTAPLIMGFLTRSGINHFILFTILGIAATGAMSFCPETYGKKCPEQIEELQYLKMKRSAKSSISGQKIKNF